MFLLILLPLHFSSELQHNLFSLHKKGMMDWIALRKPQTSIPASDILPPGLFIFDLASFGLFQKLDVFQSTEYTYLEYLCLSIFLFAEKSYLKTIFNLHFLIIRKDINIFGVLILILI